MFSSSFIDNHTFSSFKIYKFIKDLISKESIQFCKQYKHHYLIPNLHKYENECNIVNL